MKGLNLYKVAIEGVLLAGCVLLFFSCLSFDIWDAPSEYTWPHNASTGNWCGVIGAIAAYYLMYYVGPGVFLLFGALACLLTANLAGVKIRQIALRLIGLALLVAALSGTYYMVRPYSDGGFAIGNGGILGIATGNYLKSHVAVLGTSIILGCAWLVGAILLADSLVLMVLRWFGTGLGKVFGFAIPAWSAAKERSQNLGDIWTRLSDRQKDEQWLPSSISEDDETMLETASEIDEEESEEYEEEESDESEELEDTAAVEADGQPRKPIKVKRIKRKKPKPYIPKSYEDYELPPLNLLEEPITGFEVVQTRMVEQKAETLEGLLAEFGVDAHVVNAEPGPAITMYELQLAPGIKVSKITTLANDMARALGAGSVRVVAPLPGKHTIGIEAPNSQREIVRMKELMERGGPQVDKMHIPLFLGKSSSGEVLVSDLAEMPHCLIAGTTGSGKSVCINTIITSVLLTKRPDEVKLILIDPKMVEMSQFESIPHLMCPTVTDMQRAEQILEWATTKMDERYELLSEAKVRNIASYNLLTQEEIIDRFKPSTPEEEAKIPKKLPYIVIVIDELADLMMTAAKEVESYIVRIAQKSRAIGIHLVIATQRPQATVVTGLIKSNMPARIAFRVAARMDSRIILDQNGGETLLGQGDMLFLKPGTSDLVRAQGAFLEDSEIRFVVDHLKEVAQPQFHPELMQLNTVDISSMPKDEMFDQAVRVVLETKRGSVSLLQRRLSIGYARASRIIEMMAASGLLGEYKGSQAREVTMSLKEYEAMKKRMVADEVAGYKDLTDEFEDDDDGEEEYEEYEEEQEDDEEEYLEACEVVDKDDDDTDEEEYEEDDDEEEKD